MFGSGWSLGEAFDAVGCEEDMGCFLLSMRHQTLASDKGSMFEDLWFKRALIHSACISSFEM